MSRSSKWTNLAPPSAAPAGWGPRAAGRWPRDSEMPTKEAALSLQELHRVLQYDADTGVFTWKERRSRSAREGTVAGTAHCRGYSVVRVFQRQFLAHRLAWFYANGTWPPEQVDHVNGIRTDNRLCNLRLVSAAHNLQNQRAARSNNRTSNSLGVSFHKARAKWRARITVDGVEIHLGLFDTESAAHTAYLSAKRTHHPGCTI